MEPPTGTTTTTSGQSSRRTVTILFADLVGSTALGEQLDPEAFESILRRYAAVAREAITRHGGTVEKFAGDGVMAVFGVPTLHEDDALRAARAAIALREGVDRLAVQLATDFPIELDVRIGLNTGEVVAPEASDDRLVAGDTANTGARIQSAAAPGEILLGETTAMLLRDAANTEPIGPLSLKGKARPVAAARLISIRPDAEAIARRLDSPIIGRRAELAVLEAVFEEVVGHRQPRIVTVVGPPGIGKSRVVASFAATTHGRASVHRGRCLPYGDGVTFWPIRELLFDAAGIAASDDTEVARRALDRLVSGAPDGEAVSARLQALFGLSDEPITAAEIPWAVRRTLEAMAATRPLVAILDDIQWADPGVLDLVENVADLLSSSPILLLTIARPELIERRPEWFARPDLRTIRLDTLQPDDATMLIANLLGPGITPRLAARIAEATDGNPLFIEQVAAMLRDRGGSSGPMASGSTGDGDETLAVPGSIQALLAARLDALPALDRAVLQRGSVVGRTFWWSAISQLSPGPDRNAVGPGLARLVRRDFVRPDRSIFDGDEAYRFRHLLVRDAAYSSLAKSDRAQLHAGFADWLAIRVGDRADEYAEILGYHFEQSYEMGRTLPAAAGPERERVRNAGAMWLADAARRARARGDARVAAKLAERVIRLRPLTDPGSRALLPALIDSLIDLGDFAGAAAWLDRGAAAAMSEDDALLDAWCQVVALRLQTLTRRDEATDPSETQLAALATVFERSSDEGGLARVDRLRAGRAWSLGRMAEAAAGFEAAALHAQRGGLLAEAANHRVLRLNLVLMGPAPLTEVLETVEGMLPLGLDLQSVAALKLIRSVVLASVGRIVEAREEYHDGRTTLVELGHQTLAGIAGQHGGFIEIQAGDLDAAREALESSYRELAAIGERNYSSTTVAQLAAVLCELGRFDEAFEMSRVSEDSSDPADVSTEALWRTARARVLAHRGERRVAESLMARALELAGSTDMTWIQADIWRHAAEVRSTLGRSSEVQIDALNEALRLYTAKGMEVMAGRVREQIGKLAADQRPPV
jgi:class 3 adenylate cyclase/tetratricopeptide (TPR) repeat protein